MSKHLRYVAFFDMLGFKSAVLRNQDEAWGALSDLRFCMDKILNKPIEIQRPRNLIRDRIYAKIFSDSVVIFSLSNKPEDLWSIIVLCSEFFKDALHACIPLRGGISYGSFFFNNELDLYCGTPLIDAYYIGEAAQWSGITIHEEVAGHWTKNNGFTSGGQLALVRWDVPLKDDITNETWVMNWPGVFKANFKKHAPITVQDYYAPFERLFGGFEGLPENVKSKYANTVSFINHSRIRGFSS